MITYTVKIKMNFLKGLKTLKQNLTVSLEFKGEMNSSTQNFSNKIFHNYLQLILIDKQMYYAYWLPGSL